jgi:soluble lytic murein transglycosylase-like protein
VQTETGLVMGTVNYMSPEQARGLPVDERTDIWSVGVVLYEMLTGRLPFTGVTRIDTMVAILEREPAPLSQVGNGPSARPHLQSIINKCLRKNVAERYRSVTEMSQELKSAGERALTKKHAFVWPIALAVLLLVIATAGSLIYRRQPTASAVATTTPPKLYAQMSERERLDFIASQEHRISNMMSKRSTKLNDDAVRVIKAYVDRDVDRLNRPPGNISAVYERAEAYVPLIARAFAARKVPVVIGIYLPVIESAYRECYVSELGATGLFQFMPQTAAHYGVERRDMCNAEKMTPAAAHFFADRMAELGEDSDSVTLVLLSYNRGEEWVRNSLRQLRGTENYERNFWTLLANKRTLDEMFRDESAGYVPSFFAAAIIGENPEAFGLHTPPLTTLAGV